MEFDFKKVVEATKRPSTGRQRFDKAVVVMPEADAKTNAYSLNEAAVRMLDGEGGEDHITVVTQDENVFIINLKDNGSVVRDTAILRKNGKFTNKDFAEVTADFKPGKAYVLVPVTANNLPEGAVVVNIGDLYEDDDASEVVQDTATEDTVSEHAIRPGTPPQEEETTEEEAENEFFNNAEAEEADANNW